MAAVDMYVDTDGSGASSPYASWATAAQKLVTALEDGACDPGSTIYMQGAAVDTQAAFETFTSEGTSGHPIRIIGCKDGTSNEPPVAADFSTRVAADMPKVQITGGTNDINISGSISFQGIEFDISDALWCFAAYDEMYLMDCKVTANIFGTRGNSSNILTLDCEITANIFNMPLNGAMTEFIGTILKSADVDGILSVNGSAFIDVLGCDLSDSGNDINLLSNPNHNTPIIFRNCKLKATWALHEFTPTRRGTTELISCNGNTASRGSTTSFQDYEKESRIGTVDAESVILRTGGADDGADGAFSYAMVCFANAALQGRPGAVITTPWMSVWVPGGASKTLTIYFTNDGAGDLNDDVICCEFLTPNNNDTTQHLTTYDPSLVDRADGTNAVTDDTASTWVTHNTHKQKFSVTTTPGYEGWAYARVHLGQNEATPDVIYIDPRIEVT